MANTQEQGRPLPKFGDWDVNDPAAAEGFSIIFSKARNEKKGNVTEESGATTQSAVGTSNSSGDYRYTSTKKWFCCC